MVKEDKKGEDWYQEKTRGYGVNVSSTSSYLPRTNVTWKKS